MDENKIKEVFSDEDFVKQLFALETPQQVQAAVGAKGLDLSIAEIEMIRERIVNGNGELTNDELDSVAGGALFTAIALAGAVAVILLGGILATAAAGGLVADATRGRW